MYWKPKSFYPLFLTRKIWGRRNFGNQIKKNNVPIALVQYHYVESILKKFDHFDQKPVSTPYDSSVKLVKNNGRCIYNYNIQGL